MAKVVATRNWPDGDMIQIIIRAEVSPDALEDLGDLAARAIFMFAEAVREVEGTRVLVEEEPTP